MKKPNFWNKEYQHSTHLALSDEPAEDLIKFTRWLERKEGRAHLNVTCAALDLGCGNGRNLIYLAQNFNMRGLGYDTSGEAIAQAKNLAKDLPLEFIIRSIAEPIPLADSSVTIALDMMSSHVLLRDEREKLRDEIVRVLRPGGYLFFKSFLLDEDKNAIRMLREFPGPEDGTYIHPEIGAVEYVWTEDALVDFFTRPSEAFGEGGSPPFVIHKIEKSHKHLTKHNEAWKRRTIAAYLEKP